MVNFLRSLKFGTINFFGIALPGFLLIFFFTVGFLVPFTSLILSLSSFEWNELMQLYNDNKLFVVIVIILFSYVFGYILRLISPDDLDNISGDIVVKKNNEDDWPYTGAKGDKFPYFNFRGYLQARNLNHLLKYVKWGPDKKPENEEKNNDNKWNKRSKTVVNIMKLEILLYCPEFATINDSNEAHIRLMAGTWQSIKFTKLPVIIGIVISLYPSTLYLLKTYAKIAIEPLDIIFKPYFLLLLLVSGTLYGIMNWAEENIKSLFHYRRVSELFFIVQTYHLMKEWLKKQNMSDKLTPDKLNTRLENQSNND